MSSPNSGSTEPSDTEPPDTKSSDTGRSSDPARPPDLEILYDGACPLCLREVRFLGRRDERRHGASPRLGFVNIDAPDYDPAAHGGVTYRQAMGRIHALTPEGTVLTDVEVFRRAYGLIGLGWIYAPSRWPLLQPLADWIYRLWAARRLSLTGRPDLERLCHDRCSLGSAAAESGP